jgi:hypothetical protein
MYLAYTSNGRSVRAGDDVKVAGRVDHGFKVVSVTKPNSKKPQGAISVKAATNTPVTVTPREIGAEWMA